MRTPRRLSFLVEGFPTHWRWFIGRSYVVIWAEQEGFQVARYVARAADVKGISPSSFERGKYKGSSDGSVTPQDVKNYIHQKILTGEHADQHVPSRKTG